MMRLRRVAQCAALLVLVALAAGGLQAQARIHGADSTFVTPTLKIAWAVLKGTSEDATAVIIRVANSADVYRAVRVDGVDPFSNNRKVLVTARPIARQVDLSLLRAGFGEHPSCEIHLYRSQPISADQNPDLTVYYLGVPDTTPEFPTREALERYLETTVGATK